MRNFQHEAPIVEACDDPHLKPRIYWYKHFIAAIK